MLVAIPSHRPLTAGQAALYGFPQQKQLHTKNIHHHHHLSHLYLCPILPILKCLSQEFN